MIPPHPRHPPHATAHARCPALDWLNFLLADVQGGLGPFLAIYLTAGQHWDAAQAGLMLTIGGLATVVASAPMGELVDSVMWKRGIVTAGAAVVALAAAIEALWPQFWPVAVAQLASGLADAAFPAAIAALSLGLVGRQAYGARVGRNQAFNHAGNVVTAVLSGLAGWLVAPVAVLWAVTGFAVASILAVLRIDPAAIDHVVARGGDDGIAEAGSAGAAFSGGATADREATASASIAGSPGSVSPASPLRTLATCRKLLWFTLSVTLFHFANAAMLPLAGERLAFGGGAGAGTLWMAACIVVAQLVMIGVAVLAGHTTDRWGRKPLFLLGFAALPLRGLLFALTGGPDAILAVQALDGIGAGLFGVLFPLVVADLTRGTGRYNLALGAASACLGLGAALSNVVAGVIVSAFGFVAAFLVLTAFALAALAVFALAVPETRRQAAPLSQAASAG